jgi:WD40 repeat protein
MKGVDMLRFKSLFYSLSVCLGIIFILSISSASAFASEKPEIFVQLGHTDLSGVGSKAVFSHAGKYLSSAGDSGAIKLWEVETGREIKTLLGHSVNLTLLAFSHDDRYLLSGSVDKTIKLWDVSTGKEIRTFTGHKDFVSYGAFSPDGKTAATSDRNEIKLWKIETGREIKSFQGNEHFGKGFTSIYSMIFSPDGKYLVSVANGGRIVAWEVSSGARIVQIDRDELFSGNIDNFLRFSSDEKVIISGMKRIIFVDLFAKKAKIIPIESPLIDVSQDEKYILCNDYGSTQLELFDLNTGKKVWDLQPPSKYGMALFKASFSPDNKFVLLYGSDNILKLYDRATGNELRSFKSEVKAPSSGVAFSKDGKYAVSSVVSHEGLVSKLWNLHKASFDRDIEKTKQLEQILRMYKEVEKSKDEKVFKKAEKLNEEIEYYSYASSINFHDKNNNKYYKVLHPFSTTYRINTLIFYEVPKGKFGEAISDEKREINKLSAPAEITAYTLGDKYVLTGSKDKTIKLFEFPSGRYIRTFAGHLGEITGLTFSPDGKYILSASSDGTNRLWDISTGKEIAQFISFKDGEWVVITPEGYFNASPGGAKHLNVRVGNQVYSIDNFYEKFFNPVYVASVLQGKKVDAVADIRKGILLPPVVRITSPAPGKEFSTDTLTVTVSAKDTGGGIDEIRLYHNGKAIGEDTRAVKVVSRGSEAIREYTVSLVDGVNTFRAVGFSKDRTESNPYELIVKLTAPSKDVSLYVFAVGINKYKNPALNLNYAEPDARGIADFFKRQGKGLFKNVEIREIYNEQVTKENIVSKLGQLQNINPQDAVLIYLAGHGENINDKWYFIPHELTYPEREEDVKAKGISSDELSGYMKNIKAQKILMLIDACKSGAVLIAFRGFEDRKALSQLSRSTGVHIVAASTKDQFAAEVKELGHGVFTYTLLEGLGGKAAGKGEAVTVRKLMGYVEEKLPEITKKYKQEAQYPVVDSRGMDFPLVIVK